MKKLGANLRTVAQWLDQRSVRERVMILAAVLVVGIFSSYAFYFNPQGSRRVGITAQITELNATVTALSRQAEAIKARGQVDPDQDQRTRLQQLQTELDHLAERLKALTVDMISPQDMADVLRSLLLRQAGMRLVRLENYPAEVLLPEAENKGGADDAKRIQLYRHPMRIIFSGTYLQALDYVRSLETLPRKLFWDDLEIVVKDHPQAEISLTVHTLSMRKGWIGA
jgi:MSHA biogenesis protein MshJ